jgi:hypothetical protein
MGGTEPGIWAALLAAKSAANSRLKGPHIAKTLTLCLQFTFVLSSAGWGSRVRATISKRFSSFLLHTNMRSSGIRLRHLPYVPKFYR